MRTLSDTALITLSADPRALDPGTVRQVIREAGLHQPQAAADLTYFLDCVTVRRLLSDGEVDRAELCAQQLGHPLAAFTPVAPETTLVVPKADGVDLDIPAMQQRYATSPDRAQLLRELRWHITLKCPSLSYGQRIEQMRLAANAVILGGGGAAAPSPVTTKEIQGLVAR